VRIVDASPNDEALAQAPTPCLVTLPEILALICFHTRKNPNFTARSNTNIDISILADTPTKQARWVTPQVSVLVRDTLSPGVSGSMAKSLCRPISGRTGTPIVLTESRVHGSVAN